MTDYEKYQKYISSSPIWKEKRKQRLEIDNHTCVKCGYTKTLQVHHKTYERLFNEDVENDLETLCQKCHDVETDIMRRERYQLIQRQSLPIGDQFQRKIIEKEKINIPLQSIPTQMTR